MDYVFLEGLEIPCRVGCTLAERSLPQALRVDVRMGCASTRAAARSDRLEDALDYSVALSLVAGLQGLEFHLLEAVAERLAQLVLTHTSAEVVQLTVRKRPPLASLLFSGVEITRTRADLDAPPASQT